MILPQARALQRWATQRALLAWMEHEDDFQQRLRSPRFVPTEHPQHADWTAARAQYESRLPAPFTRHWAMDYGKDAEFRPITWLTATFLHGSTGHLLGNMLFLFLFGFSVELALGRTTYLAFYLLGGLGGSALSAWAYSGTGSYGLGLFSGGRVCADGYVCRAVPAAACAVFLPAVFLFQLRHGASVAAIAHVDRERAAAALAQRPRRGLHGPLGWLSRRGFADGPGDAGHAAAPWKCPRRRLPCPMTVSTPMWPTPSAWPRP